MLSWPPIRSHQETGPQATTLLGSPSPGMDDSITRTCGSVWSPTVPHCPFLTCPPRLQAASTDCLIPHHVLNLAHSRLSHRPEHLLVLSVGGGVGVWSISCVSQGPQGQLMDAWGRIMCG